MRKFIIITILTILAIGILSFTAYSDTITQGTLDVDGLATSISGDLEDYSIKRDQLVKNIKFTQSGIEKLKQDYSDAENQKEKIIIKARTLRESSGLLSSYSQFYRLNMETVQSILPKIDKLRQHAKKSSLNSTARLLKDPVFRTNMKNLYGNISAFALNFGQANSKKQISGLLQENELLYQTNSRGENEFNNIIKNIDKVSDSLRSIYAKTVLRSNILEQKKVRTEMAVELMRYALALKPIQQTMLELNPEGIINVPDIDYAEFVDPIINETGLESGQTFNATYSDPQVESSLKGYQDGPDFLK